MNMLIKGWNLHDIYAKISFPTFIIYFLEYRITFLL